MAHIGFQGGRWEVLTEGDLDAVTECAQRAAALRPGCVRWEVTSCEDGRVVTEGRPPARERAA